MRTHGKLTKWNDDRGFGFIEPATGTEGIFVHISAFPRDGIRPCIGEMVSYEVDLTGDGKRRAVRVMRPVRATAPRTPRSRSTPTRQSPMTAVASLLLLAVIGWYGYSRLTADHATDNTPLAAPMSPAVPTVPAPASPPVRPTPAPISHAAQATPEPTSYTIPATTVAPLQPFQCDGRTRCAQMTSCAEATYFIKQCPGTKMDGDRDGVPCEGRWCG